MEQHRAAGATVETWLGVALPSQFSDPLAEHQAARRSAGLVDTNFRAVFSLTGPDRVRYLHAVLTNSVADLVPGQGVTGLLLNAQGHILAELDTLMLEDRLLVLGHQSVRQNTAETLDRFIIMDDATLADETLGYGTLALEGPAADEIARATAGVELAGMPPLAHTEASVRTASGQIPCRIIRRSLFGSPGVEYLAARDLLPALWAALLDAVRARGAAPIGYRALNALRLEAGVPWFGVDFDEHHIPHEAALEGTHLSFTKGCYTGQEIVERVRSRGHVNRRRAGLKFSAAEPPQPGATLTAGNEQAGVVTSAAFSPLAGTAIGMGYVRREHGAPGTKLQCGAVGAEVITLPLEAARPKTHATSPSS